MSINIDQILGVLHAAFEYVKTFAQNNWGLFCCILVGVVVYGIWSNAKTLFCIIATCAIIFVLTQLGVIPPLNVIIEEVKALAGL